MPDYRRNRVPGRTFFTVNLRYPGSDLLVTQIDILRNAVRRVRARMPFRIDAPIICHKVMPTSPVGVKAECATLFRPTLAGGSAAASGATRPSSR
jgi:hypothetical protein